MPLTQTTSLDIAKAEQDATTGFLKVELVDSAGTNIATVSSGGALKVDGSASTQPVSQSTAANLKATVLLQDGSANALTSSQSALDVTSAGSFLNLVTSTTTTIKSGAGILHAIIINTKGVANTATLYDNTAGSGSKIGTLDTTLSTASLIYDVKFTTGLTIVTAGGTPADLTVVYK